MLYDDGELEFGGLAYRLAASEFAGSFSDDEDGAASDRLWADYVQEGRPKNQKAWLRARLAALFLYVDEPPRWIEANPIWPFHLGNPMIFIRQVELPNTSISNEHLDTDAVLYVFGARSPVIEHDGWEMCYRVDENHKSLAGL